MRITVLTILFTIKALSLSAQAPLVKQWDKRFGGTDSDHLSSFQQTIDKGYVLCGHSTSEIDGDKTQPSWGAEDYWIIKIDSLGNKQWDRRFGGTEGDRPYSIQQTNDGGYIIGGFSASGISGDKTQSSRGNRDYWIIKTDPFGNKQWDKRFGGAALDELRSLKQTTDGGYILGGYSQSGINGDKTETVRGGYDYWVVKTDSLGNKQWDKRFGGSRNDGLSSIVETQDDGYILGGFSYSGISGDRTQANWDATTSTSDYWIVKIDSLGNKQWDKRFGGLNYDHLYSLQQTNDGGYILGGFSGSGISGDKTQTLLDFPINLFGIYADYWIVKIDSLGNKQWDRTFGGTAEEDDFGNVFQTSDGGYLVTGTSYSFVSGDKTENNLGYEQVWIVKTNSFGTKEWDKTILTTGHDEIGLAIQTTNDCYVIANYTNGGVGGDKTQPSQGDGDYWIVKFCETNELKTSIFFSDLSCNVSGDGAASVSISIGAPAFRYHWNTGDTTASISNLSAGTYSVTVTDARGSTHSDTIIITEPPAIISNFEAVPTTINVIAPFVTLTNNSTNYDSLVWFLDEEPITIPPDNQYTLTDTGTHCFSLVAMNTVGCADTATQCVTVYEGDNIISIPQAFVPDGNGLNRYFLIFGLLGKLHSFQIRIYNRWGEEVFSSTDPNFKWDGTYKGKTQDTGVFVYQIATHFEGEQQPRFYNGNVTLIR